MSHHARSLAFALVLLAAGLPASMASAAQFPVNDTGDVPLDPTAPPCVCRIAPRSTRCTLRAAIQAANACVGHDVIQIQPLGHYDLTIAGAGESLGQTGDLDIREGVTIQGNGVWVSQHAQDRVFDVAVAAGEDVNISNLRIGDGRLYSDRSGADGGGIRSVGATLTLEAVTVEHNYAARHGGGIAVLSGELTIVGAAIRGNRASQHGGGLLLNHLDAALLDGVIVYNNYAPYYGGGLMADVGAAPLEVRDSFLQSNTAANGGGAVVLTSTGAQASFVRCELTQNSATLGGALLTRIGSAASEIVIRDSAFHANRASSGGAIFGGGGQIERTTFSSNVAVARGGAIVVHVLPGGGSAPLAIDDSTFYQNRTDGAGGALSVRTDSVVARHVTFDSNTAVTSGAAIEVVAPVSVCSSLFTTSVTSGPDQCSAPVSTGYTVSTDFSCLAASGDQLVFNAGVGAFANHGGPTSTVELLANSPAIDAGDPATCSAVDQRGEARPAGACDAGAFERE